MGLSKGIKALEKEVHAVMRWGVFTVSLLMLLGILLVILIKNL